MRGLNNYSPKAPGKGGDDGMEGGEGTMQGEEKVVEGVATKGAHCENADLRPGSRCAWREGGG